MTSLDAVAPYAHWLLRAGLASVFVYHGLLKFMNQEGFAQMLPISFTETVFVALAEVVGGTLVLLGGFGKDTWSDLVTRLGAAILIPVLLGAIALVHWGRWNFVPTENFPMGGMEFQVTLMLVALYLVTTGNQAFPCAPAIKRAVVS